VRVRVRVSRDGRFALGGRVTAVTLTGSKRGVFHFFHFVTLGDARPKRDRAGEGAGNRKRAERG